MWIVNSLLPKVDPLIAFLLQKRIYELIKKSFAKFKSK